MAIVSTSVTKTYPIEIRKAASTDTYNSSNRRNTSYSNIKKAVNRCNKNLRYRENNSLSNGRIEPSAPIIKSNSSRHKCHSQNKNSISNDVKITINSCIAREKHIDTDLNTIGNIIHNQTREQTQYWAKLRKMIIRLIEIQDYSAKNYDELKSLNKQVKDLIDEFPYNTDHRSYEYVERVAKLADEKFLIAARHKVGRLSHNFDSSEGTMKISVDPNSTKFSRQNAADMKNSNRSKSEISNRSASSTNELQMQTVLMLSKIYNLSQANQNKKHHNIKSCDMHYSNFNKSENTYNSGGLSCVKEINSSLYDFYNNYNADKKNGSCKNSREICKVAHWFENLKY